MDLTVLPERLAIGSLWSMRGQERQLLFHINLHHRGAGTLRLSRVVLGLLRRGQLLSQLTLEEPLLSLRLRPVPWIMIRDRQTMAAAHRWRGALARPKGNALVGPGERISLSDQVFLLHPGEVPDALWCRVEHDEGASETQVNVSDPHQQTRLLLPVSGRWWVMEGHRFDEDHADAMLPSQGFAYDLGVLGPGLTTFEGDPRRNASYLAHGREVLAAADGEVVAAQGGSPENEPVGVRPSWDQVLQRPEELAGNYIVLKHAEAEYTAYLHLRPELSVKRGDRVRAGQPIGSCGNSGNSLESHLHFQLQDGPDPLRAHGLPARFSNFTVELGHLRLHVPPGCSMPLPTYLVIEPGRSPRSAELPPSFGCPRSATH